MGNPTVTPLAETFHDGGFIVSLANGHRSIDEGLLGGGAKVLGGTVLGMATTLTSGATSAALGTNTGNGVMGAVTVQGGPVTQLGVYTLTYTDPTHYTVVSPDGDNAVGVNGTPFSALGIGFTMTSGGVAMVAGDGFTITVVARPGKAVATSVANAGNTGNATSSAVTCVGFPALPGNYKLVVIGAAANAGSFEVEDPSGQLIGTGTVGVAFSAGGIAFTLADGATDFVVGDGFVITVNPGSGKFLPWNPSSGNGSNVVAGILYATKDVTAGDKFAAVVARACEVNASELIWPAGSSAAEIVAGIAGLKAIGILAR